MSSLQIHLSAEEVGYLAEAVRRLRSHDEKRYKRLLAKFGDDYDGRDQCLRRLRVAEKLLPRLRLKTVAESHHGQPATHWKE